MSVYLKQFSRGPKIKKEISAYLDFYNEECLYSTFKKYNGLTYQKGFDLSYM